MTGIRSSKVNGIKRSGQKGKALNKKEEKDIDFNEMYRHMGGTSKIIWGISCV